MIGFVYRDDELECSSINFEITELASRKRQSQGKWKRKAIEKPEITLQLDCWNVGETSVAAIAKNRHGDRRFADV